MQFEHYRIRYYESERYIYYISSLGYFERFNKQRYPDMRIYEDRLEVLASHISKNVARTFVGNKWVTNHQEVIKYFKPQLLEKGRYIKHINGNIWDCNLENLAVVSQQEIQKKVGRGVKLQATINGERCVYNSISECAENIYVVRLCVIRHLQGKTKSPYLHEIQLKRI